MTFLAMEVTVRFYAELRQALGKKEMVVPVAGGTTLEGLLAHLAAEFRGTIGKEALWPQGDGGQILVLVNGKDPSFTGGLDTLLTQDTVVDLMPPLAGG